MAFDGSSWPASKGGAAVRRPPPTELRPKPKPVPGTGMRPGQGSSGTGGYPGEWEDAPKRKPKYFGPARTPKRTPFGKRGARVKNPIPALRFNPLGLLFDGLGFPGIPGGDPDPFSFEITEPGWCSSSNSCPSTDPPYSFGPLFSQNRIAAGSCAAITCILNQACPSGSASWTPGDPMGRTLANQPLNCVAMFEYREVLSGGVVVDIRCSILKRWCGPPSVAGGPTNDPAFEYTDPGRSPLIPHTRPDPFAEQPPGFGQPFPKPIPYRLLPKYPDPDDAVLPGALEVVDPKAWPEWYVDPYPGVTPPIPIADPLPEPGSPTLPGTPLPGRVVPVRPWVPPVVTQPQPGNPSVPTPPVLPPYLIPGTAMIQTVTSKGSRWHRGWDVHAKVRPKLKEKEKKFKVSAAMQTLNQALGFTTEMLDYIDVLYGAIPCQVKYDQGMMVKGRKVTPQMKAAFIAANLDKVDGTEMLRLGAKNAFEDRFYGMTSTEKAQYEGSYKAGINTRGGNSMQKRQDINPDTGEPENPVIKAFNDGVDEILGPRPKSFTCCGGKKNVCAKVQFGRNVKSARGIRAVFGREAEQNFWIAAKNSTKYKRNAYSQARAGYRWQPRQLME